MKLLSHFSRRYINFLVCILFCTPVLLAEESEQQYATGDWGGTRSELEEQGIDIQSVITNEYVSNTHGGLSRNDGNLVNYDLTLSVDTEKASLWDGGTFFVYMLGDWGKDPTSFVGDLQASSNIESPDDLKLYELWYDHSFLDGKVAWLIGAHDYNSEFDSLEYASSLFNSSFGISVDSSQVGPSIFPTTALATRVRINPSEHSYIQSAIYDGVPGDPNHPKGTHFKIDSDDGMFWGTEAGILSNSEEPSDTYYKAAIGFWNHTTDFADYSDTQRSNNSGWYGIGETSLLHEEDPAQGLGTFIQLGFANPNRNEIGQYYGGGLMYTGLITYRDEDITSFGIAHARHGNDYLALNPEADRAETAIEINYRLQITPYFAVQPDFQFIKNPGTDPQLKDASVIAVRFELVM